MSLLTLIQNHCQIHALGIPTSVVGATDTTTKQLYALTNELVQTISFESDWQGMTLEGLWTLLPQEDQGDMATLAPSGMRWIDNSTFYDRTLRRPLYGPISGVEWQALKALPNPGPFYKYRIRAGRLLINPVPVAPYSQIAFEYTSGYAVKDTSGALKNQFTVDTDVFVLPEVILLKGLAFRWKQVKGLPYQADESKYYDLLTQAIARDATKRKVNLAYATPVDLAPGVFVPSGSWNVR